MDTEELQFLEKNILNLIKDNNTVKMEVILDYLDYINKVRYSEKDISPILNKLVLENKIIFSGFYSLNKKSLTE